MEKAVALAEILGLIFEHIDEPRSLAACARVSRLWNEEAIPLLWQGSIWSGFARIGLDAAALNDLAKHPERFRHYSKYFKYLYLRHGRGLGPYPDLWVPELWKDAQYISLEVDLGSDEMQESHMEMLLHKNLKALELFGGYYSDRFLTSLQARCPGLRWLLIDNRSESMSSRGVLELLQNMPELQMIEFHVGVEMIMSEPVLIQITNLKQLGRLDLGWCDPITQHIVQASQFKLPNLRCLKLQRVDPAGLRALLPHLCQLEEFEFDSLTEFGPRLSPGRDFFQPLSSCYNLLVLTLSFKRAVHISEEDLRAFAGSCRKLRAFEFSVRMFEFDPLDPPPYSWVIPAFAENFRFLEELIYDRSCTLNKQDLVNLARNCPLLTMLSVKADLDVALLDDLPEDIAFPKLKSLVAHPIHNNSPFHDSIRRLDESGSDLEKIHFVEELEKTLQQRMPRLEKLKWYRGCARKSVGELLRDRLESLDSHHRDYISTQLRFRMQEEIVSSASPSHARYDER